MSPLVLATANPHKAAEIAAILGPAVTLLPRPSGLGEVEESGETLADNARLKAAAVAAYSGRPAVADDTGLEVAALGGAPGVRSARFAGEGATYSDNVALLLARLAAAPDEDRRARFVTVALVRWPDGREVVAQGSIEGTIALKARGEGGFGYDPVFVPEGAGGLTFAELSPEDKNSMSHRGRALRELRSMLH